MIHYLIEAMKQNPKDHKGNYMLYLASLLGIFFTPEQLGDENDDLFQLLTKVDTKRFIKAITTMKSKHMVKCLQYKSSLDQARRGVSVFSRINMMFKHEDWIGLLQNYTLLIDKELVFLKKIADAKQKIPKKQYIKAWWNIQMLFEHPDLGDRNTKRGMLITLLKLSENH